MCGPVKAATSDGSNSIAAEVLEVQLDDITQEDEARKVLQPFMADLKKLPSEVVEKIVSRQWWTLAHEIVAASHTQQVDLSFAVRKAVRALKDEAEELLRTLNPKYGQAQQVSPAFQWAQNDTCLFLTIKYTVRWNAPGALEVTEADVNMSNSTFSFSGLGKHSNNKYRYSLMLSLFDNIDPGYSSWSAASVGKLSVTLRKRWARKWPRLLADKKTKIGNMHVWMEMQDKMDSTLSIVSSASNSPVTCSLAEKLYCLPSDSCKKSDNCSQCPGKPTPDLENAVCGGVPLDVPIFSFTDDDLQETEIGGQVKITRATKEFDIDEYVIYYGKDETTKLEDDNGQPMLVGSVSPREFGDLVVRIPQNTAVTATMTHLLCFARNAYGENPKPGNQLIRDAFVPKAKPGDVSFLDEDGDRGVISGSLRINVPEHDGQIKDFVVYWGSSPKRKLGLSEATISLYDKKGGDVVTHYINRGTKIREGATHLIVYSKNVHGENPSGSAMKIVDLLKPCLAAAEASCPKEVRVMKTPEKFTISVVRAADEALVKDYTIYWGRRNCDDGGQSGAKNGILKELAVKDIGEGDGVLELAPDTVIPQDASHILAFSKGDLGESNFCVSTELPKEPQDAKTSESADTKDASAKAEL